MSEFQDSVVDTPAGVEAVQSPEIGTTTDLGLRQRKSAGKKDATVEMTIDKSTENLVTAMAEKAPIAIRPYIIKAAPFAGKAALYGEKALPYIEKGVEKGKEYWEKLQPYKPQLLAPAACGLVMCFFGGSFLTLIAAVEAYRMCGYESTLRCCEELYEDFMKLAAANKADDDRDEDGNGTPDVLEMTKQQLLTRKVLLFFRTVDPKRVTTALAGINQGFLAVVATLKLQFAKAITLGNAIGDIVKVPVHKYAVPVAEKLLPEGYKQWAVPVIDYAVKSFAISVAWTIQRVLSAFHSAIRGGLMFSRNIMEYCSIMKIIEINHEESILDEIVGYALAAVGLFFQLSMGFALPFPLNVLLLPFSMMEWFLMWAVNSTK